MKEECQRCGARVPTRRRDTGFCTIRCAKAQAEADRRSMEIELEEVKDATNPVP